MIKPDAYIHMGKCISEMEKNGFVISNLRMTKMTAKDAESIKIIIFSLFSKSKRENISFFLYIKNLNSIFL